MSTTIPSDVADQIRAQISAGQFQTEEQVLREAMSALQRRQQGLARLQAMVQEAEADVAAGRVAPFDRDALKREVREQQAVRSIVD